MSVSIKSISDSTSKVVQQLWAKGYRTNEQLLPDVGTAQQRKSLAKEMGVALKELNDFISRADLTRIDGIGGVYADMLTGAGVKSVQELGQQEPFALFDRMLKQHRKSGMARRVPHVQDVVEWVEAARSLSVLVDL